MIGELKEAFDRTVSRLKETPGTEYLMAAVGAAAGATATYYGAFRLPELVPFSPWVSAVISVGAFFGAAAGYDYLTRDTDIATVTIEGEIRRDTEPLDDKLKSEKAVRAIEKADGSARALVLEIDSPGGEPTPSEEIRAAVKEFDGPTVAFARDVCASGAYLIAAGCDHVIAREGAMVGSIGVLGSRVTFSELADRLGIEYERLTAGEYKDAGVPLEPIEEDQREYLQGLIDDHYDLFVERVAEDRDIEPAAIRDTEARIYTGRRAHELGLVDDTGTMEDAMDHAAERVGRDPDVDKVTFTSKNPSKSPIPSVSGAIHRVSYAVSSGVARTVETIDLGDRVSIKLK